MNGMDLPFDQDVEPGFKAIGTPEKADRLASARRLVAEPIAWLAAAALAACLVFIAAQEVCAGETCAVWSSPVRSLGVVVALVGGGALFLAARQRYFEQRTQLLAGVLAAVPLALVIGFRPPAPIVGTEVAALESELVAMKAALSEERTALEDLSHETALLGTALAEQRGAVRDLEAQLGAQRRATETLRQRLAAIPALSAAEVEAIASESAVDVFETRGELVVEETLRDREPALLKDLAAEEERRQTLASVGYRLAAVGPLPQGESGPEGTSTADSITDDVALVAEYLGLDEAESAVLADSEEVAACIDERKASRSIFAAMNHRMNPDRYAAYLSPCADG